MKSIFGFSSSKSNKVLTKIIKNPKQFLRAGLSKYYDAVGASDKNETSGNVIVVWEKAWVRV